MVATSGRTQQMNEQFLTCKVYPGMFSDEVAIAYRPNAGRTSVSSYFVPKDRVVADLSGRETTGMLRVLVFREGQTTWAVVPNENQTIIEIDEADLTAP
ncbi:MAG TPA: hypothetical protein VH370_17170 [Humisphaera sp.]|jgi:hypothetical protein|nr:hypothetical protein [Humisphaera sp.]